MSLDSMEVDLSKELSAPVKPAIAKQVEKAQTSENRSQKWRPAPTRREQERWDRAYKVATGCDVTATEAASGGPTGFGCSVKGTLKNKLQILTLGIGGVGLLSAYVSYTPEIAASYVVGLLGSFAYMRMLGNSVDSVADGARGLVNILVPEYGVMHLELIPMLVGFFTYKIATFTLAIEEALTIVGRKSEV